VTRCSGEGPGSKAVGWWTNFWAAGRKKLTGSTVMCSRPEGNGGGGGVRGWWSTFLDREGCTWRHGARGGNGEFGGGRDGAMQWLDGGGGNQWHRGGDGQIKKKGGSTVGGGRPV
jgi:hypothetical protein